MSVTWEILTGLMTVTGCLVTVGGVAIKLNTSIVRLSQSVERLAEFMERQQVKNDSFSEKFHKQEIVNVEVERRLRSLERNS